MKKINSLLCATLLMVSTDAFCAKVEGSIGVASDYVFRGISQSSEDPAVQGFIKVSPASDWYISAFVSEADVNGANSELELAVGFQGNFTQDFRYETELNYSMFSDEVGPDADYLEAEFRVDYNDFFFGTLAYTTDFFGTSEVGSYAEARFKLPLHDVIRTAIYTGYYSLEGPIDSYSMFGFDAWTNIGDIEFRLSFTDTDLKNFDAGDSRLFFTAAYLF